MADARAKAGKPRRPQNLQGAIYGTVLALSVTAVGSEKETDVEVLVSVVATAMVFWTVHVYASVLAAKLERDAPIRASIRSEAAKEWPLVQATMPVVLPLLLAAVGAIDDQTGYWLALVVGILVLAGFGARTVRQAKGSRMAILVVALLNAVLGLLFVVLKVLVH
jgi:hypothetical protein